MTSRKRIAFIVGFIPHYRLTFFEKLYSHQEYEWLIIHGLKENEDGHPAYRGTLHFPNQIVGSREWKIGSFYVRWQSNLLALLQDWQPQILIILGGPGMLMNWLVMYWARRKNIKIIIWHSGWEPQLGSRGNLAIKQWFARRYLNLADHVLTYSTKGATYLESLGCKPEKITICYNGMEIDHLLDKESEYRAKGKSLRKRHQLQQKKIFLYVGGMIPEKQVPMLLDVFYSLDTDEKAVLWLVGDGPDLTTILSMSKRKQNKDVIFWGRIINDVDVFFAAADYFILPGTGGLALNQALFWKLPCIVSDADGTESDLVLDGKTGFRFIAKDRDSLQVAMLKCMEMTESQKVSMGNAGRMLVLDRSNVNQMVSTFIKTIDRFTDS